MTVVGIRDAIKTALATITGLNTFDTVPESINAFPAAFVFPRYGDYDYDVGDDMVHRFEIVVLVARQGDIAESQDEIDAYCDASGTYSIKTAVDAATLSTHADAIRVIRYRDYGSLDFAGSYYIGVRFDVDVIT